MTDMVAPLIDAEIPDSDLIQNRSLTLSRPAGIDAFCNRLLKAYETH
jgi:hypothetical protein